MSSRCRGHPSGNWDNFTKKLQDYVSTAPIGGSAGGNKGVKVKYPYGTLPLKNPGNGSTSIGRGPWEGWRYGDPQISCKVYGDPDYRYFRHNYCGPCAPCLPPGFMGDPNGANPNIQYVQFDPSSLLNSGFATQEDDQTGVSPNALTACGKAHCTQCSGVFKKRSEGKPTKFKICIGDPSCTPPPCPKQDVKLYVPNAMMPCSSPCGNGDKLKDFEVQIPGVTPDCPPPPRRQRRRPVISPGCWEEEALPCCGKCDACCLRKSKETQCPSVCSSNKSNATASTYDPEDTFTDCAVKGSEEPEPQPPRAPSTICSTIGSSCAPPTTILSCYEGPCQCQCDKVVGGVVPILAERPLLSRPTPECCEMKKRCPARCRRLRKAPDFYCK